jgi:hypothetical protein
MREPNLTRLGIASSLSILAIVSFLVRPANTEETAVANPGVDFSGGWVLTDPVTSLPDLLPDAAKSWQENKVKIASAKPEPKPPSQPTAEQAAGLCFPMGFPRVMTDSTLPLYIVQSPAGVLMDFASGGPPRFIWINLPHDDSYWPTYLGESVADWQGNTLVVDTIKFVHDTYMGPQGLPHSDAMHTIERIRLTDGGKVLEDQIRIEDPKVLRNPWIVTVHFQRQENYRPAQHACQMG